MAYTSGSDTEKNEVVYEEKIAVLEFEVKDKGNAVTRLTNQLKQTLKEKEDLKAKLEHFETSSKNLNKLINSQISSKDKTGLGYGDQLNEKDSSGSELFNSVFDSRSSDGDQTNDRFKKGNEYHVVPPPLTGNYMPPLADLSFAGLDGSVYRPTTNKASATISNGEESVTQTSNFNVEMPKDNSVRTNKVLNTRVLKVKVNSVKVNDVNTVGQTTVCTVKGNGVTAVKASADKKELAIPGQMTTGKEFSNLVEGLKFCQIDLNLPTTGDYEMWKIYDIDTDPTISLIQEEGMTWFQEDAKIQEKNNADTEILQQEEEPTELVENPSSGEKSEKEVSTIGAEHSTVIPEVSTTVANLVYIRRSAEKRKDKGKAIIREGKSVQKKTKKQLEQERLSHETFIRLQEQIDVEERKRIARDAEIAKQLQEEYDKARQEQEVVAKDNQARVINWSDPAVLRYHALQNRPYSIAEVRKNMCMYLKNQGGFKMSHFKGMSSKKKQSRKKSLARKRAGEKQGEESTKRQKIEDDIEKGELKAYLDLVPREEFAMEIESLATKYPIVDWKTHVLTENFMYYQIIRADRGSKNYKIFSEMLDDFKRQDVMDLYRLVEERYVTSRPEGYDLMLWGDLKILFQSDEEDEVWRHQHEYNLISWRLFDSCGIHILLMDNGISIHMMIDKKYPLTQEMLSKMLSRKLKVDHENEMAFKLLSLEINMKKLEFEGN
ncbi:hypothetical protein Tco_0810494 [Tanacetum coccineum]